MIEVKVHTNNVQIRAMAPGREESAQSIIKFIPPGYRKYLGNGVWKVRNPWRWSQYIPAIKSALLDAQRQIDMFEDAK